MPEQQTAARSIPPDADLDELREIAAGCTACALHARGTQTVFGEGDPRAEVLVVGEQPGDQEDRQGHPFVGPAGGELDRGFEAVGIDRDRIWLTNVVKHFKWEGRGKRRIHQKPNTIEIRACLPWLRAEIHNVRPAAVVALGSTAAQALLGREVRVTRQRGELHPGPEGTVIIATVHPSSILRAPTDEDRYAARDAFHADLRVVARLLAGGLAMALRSRPRDELYAWARRLDLPGRSTLAKPELADLVAGGLAAIDRDVDPARSVPGP